MENRKRKIEYKFRVDEKESEYLNKKMKDSGCHTRRDFFLMLAKKGKIINPNKILPELARQGNNLNQIAKKINTCPDALRNQELQTQLKETLLEVEKVWQLLNRFVRDR